MKNETKQALLEALDRLVQGKPKNFELKKRAKKGTLKINNISVEKEAEKSVGAIRNHKDIAEKIKAAALLLRVELDGNSNEQVLLQNDVKTLTAEKTELRKKSKDETRKRKIAEDMHALYVTREIEIIRGLLSKVDIKQNNIAMPHIVRSAAGNVIRGKFNK